MPILLLHAIFVTIMMVTAAAGQSVVLQKELIRVEAPEGHEKYARSVLGHATAALRKLNSETGDALLVPITFVVASTEQRFLELAGGEGEQALAVAIGSKQLVVISMPAMQKSASDRIQQVLVHELAHVYLDVKTEEYVPRWVHEGVAQMVAGEWPEAPGSGSMALAAYTGGLLPLRDLVRGFPADITQRNQAYAESLSAMRFLVAEDHGNSLRHFLKSIRGEGGRAYLKSLAETVELQALEMRWRDNLKSPLSVLTIFMGSGFFWGMAALLVILAYMVKRHKSKAIHEEWAAEDAVWVDLDGMDGRDVEDPDDLYVEGDPDEWKRGQY